MSKYVFSLAGIEPVRRDPYPFTEFQTNWLNALESGEYAQGQGVLRSTVDAYCCLGVAAEIAGCPKRIQQKGAAYEYYANGSTDEPSAGYLPFRTRRELRLKSHVGTFARGVRFPNVSYADAPSTPYNVDDVIDGAHHSLASMNDCRVLLDGYSDNKPTGVPLWRAFTFREIAAYIRHDPWNVFDDPVVVVLHPTEREIEHRKDEAESGPYSAIAV